MKNKRQHFIPSSYLQAWCDPECPAGQTPYVWVFSKDGSSARKKAPDRIFYETDMYTVRTDDGHRDLTIETNLSRIESEFAKLRKNKLDKNRALSSVEQFYLCMFVAAMYGRTKAYGEHWRRQWKEVLDFMESATEEHRSQLAAGLAMPSPNDAPGLTIDEVREHAEYPIQKSLAGVVTEVAPRLFRTPYMILETQENNSFVTSDDPCVWFDPAANETPEPFGAGGLISPTLEITLPLSPHQMLFFGRKLMASGIYMPLQGRGFVDQLNKRTRVMAHEHFVTNHPSVRLSWFS